MQPTAHARTHACILSFLLSSNKQTNKYTHTHTRNKHTNKPAKSDRSLGVENSSARDRKVSGLLADELALADIRVYVNTSSQHFYNQPVVRKVSMN